MSYQNNNAPNLTQFYSALTVFKALLASLESRIDIQVTASTDPDADYAAEVVDARVDAWGTAHESAGANIRNVERAIKLGLEAVNQNYSEMQSEVDQEAQARTEMIVACGEIAERRKQEIFTEEEIRVKRDDNLQYQIDQLAEAVLQINSEIVRINKKINNL